MRNLLDRACRSPRTTCITEVCSATARLPLKMAQFMNKHFQTFAFVVLVHQLANQHVRVQRAARATQVMVQQSLPLPGSGPDRQAGRRRIDQPLEFAQGVVEPRERRV